ncbi:hypothetical protein K1719_000508 [Acacia pycnantha]|nr:hypothetical protein K1719_000508 [Acacia pycnantha]
MFILHDRVCHGMGGWALVQTPGSSSSSWGKKDSLENQTRNLWISFRLPAESPEMETPFSLRNVYAL